MKQTNRQKRLAARRKDFDAGPQSDSKDAKKVQRWKQGSILAGGYHRPGSNNK